MNFRDLSLNTYIFSFRNKLTFKNSLSFLRKLPTNICTSLFHCNSSCKKTIFIAVIQCSIYPKIQNCILFLIDQFYIPVDS